MLKIHIICNLKKKELNKIQLTDKFLHEIENDITRDYVGEFEMVGNLSLGD